MSGRALSFGARAEAYERFRPGYPEDLFDLVGPDASRSFLDDTAPRGGRIEYLMRFALGTTTYAGTSEIQYEVIARRLLDDK